MLTGALLPVRLSPCMAFTWNSQSVCRQSWAVAAFPGNVFGLSESSICFSIANGNKIAALRGWMGLRAGPWAPLYVTLTSLCGLAKRCVAQAKKCSNLNINAIRLTDKQGYIGVSVVEN